ncbi:MAG: prohibitin family protein [Pseudanabaenaceae cyanobacterium SKYGB_i_bin29]|nr:prohibitin family protein [Pseudanabaenaceae cyanobacterium SKYG29]MDW8420794.1 prohibitin family protein [Pseudanabaenaceae cyanobacterium SKYGB_i_bin29]
MNILSPLRGTRLGEAGNWWHLFLFPIGAVVVFVILRNPPFFYVTPPGRASVVFNIFSGIKRGKILQPGMSFVMPFVEQPISYDVRTRVWEFTDATNSPRLAGPPISIISSDGQSFTLDANIALRPNPDTLDQLHAEIGENYMTNIVIPIVRSKVRDVAAKFDSSDFYKKEKRDIIQQQAKELIASEMPKVTVQGQQVPLILVEAVLIESAQFPSALKDSIERKQVQSILAQTAAVRAKIQDKETDRVLILAEANQKAIELKGRASAVSKNLADLLFYEKLEERLRKGSDLKVMRVEGNTTVFLNVDSDKLNPRQAAAAKP